MAKGVSIMNADFSSFLKHFLSQLSDLVDKNFFLRV